MDVIRLFPGSGTIGSDGQSLGLSEEQLEFLKSLGLRGSLGLSVQPDSGLGETAAKGQAAIVFTHQPKSRVELRQPKGVNVLYVQVGDKWIMHPENAPTIGRKIVFWPAGQNGAEIDLHIDPESSGSFSWYPAATSP